MEMPLGFRLPYFRELIQCAHNLYSWSFNSRFELTFSNCPNAPIFQTILSLGRVTDLINGSDFDRSRPVIFTNSLGLIWVTELLSETDSDEKTYHLIGPAFYDSITRQSVYSSMQGQRLSATLQSSFIAVMEHIPVIPITRMMEYALMLHYTLTGQRITNSELQFHSPKSSPKPEFPHEKRHGTWAAEQALLKLVEDGNLDYKKARSKFNLVGNVGKLAADNPLRQVKNQIIIYTALCTRAAIRGGLTPETAYTLSDQYIQMAEAAVSVAELAEISGNMQEDFIRRVHRAKLESGISRPIQICRDYIQLHLAEKITLESLAEQVNYSVNYLSRKFRRETGKNVMDYITECKVERAKEMLLSGEESIQSISEQLGFSTQSYFGAQFKKITGMSAGEYRSRYGRTVKDP